MIVEVIKFLVYSGLIVVISKYILVTTLRKLAENLNLKPKTVGNVAGLATSVPELLTVTVSSFNGLIGASLVNILSSNVINFIQYMASIYGNKNQKSFQNKAIKIDLLLVGITIVIPIVFILLDWEINIVVVPIFVILYFLFRSFNHHAHKLYLKEQEKALEKQIEEEEKKEKGKKTIKYVLYLIITGILLFIIGDILGKTLENLCDGFGIPQFIIGILLGIITSVPELITFFEAQKHYKAQKEDDILGVVEATNNLLTSNILNLFIIQSIGIMIFIIIS